MPAEELLFFAIHRRDDLRRGHRAPLRKQMRQFIIRHAAALAHFHPALQPFKPERIRAVLHAHVDQLHRRALAALSGIERRREQRREQHRAAPAHGQTNEVFQKPPVFLAENRHMVIICQAVAMEPVRANQLLRGQHARQNPNRHRRRRINRFFVRIPQPQFDRVFSRRAGAVRLNVDKIRVPLARLHAQRTHLVARLLIAQQVGIHARRFAQIVVVRIRQRRQMHRHGLYRADAQMLLQRRSRLQIHALARRLQRAAEGQLEGNRLILEAFEALARVGFPHRLVQKHLRDRR